MFALEVVGGCKLEVGNYKQLSSDWFGKHS